MLENAVKGMFMNSLLISQQCVSRNSKAVYLSEAYHAANISPTDDKVIKNFIEAYDKWAKTNSISE